jgi:tetratricopeptide (TPR) repeat protein
MLFCPFCGKPIVIPEQDDAPLTAPVEAAPASSAEGGDGNDARDRKPESVTAASATDDAGDKPTSVLTNEDVSDAAKDAAPVADAAAELLDWDRARKRHMEADVWARPEAPAEDFSPIAQEKADEKLEESDWKEEIIRKKEAVVHEKKPPEMKREEETPVRLEGGAPKLELDIQGAKPRDKGKKHRKQGNTLVPPKTMDPDDIFMDRKRAPYEKADPYDDEADEFRSDFAFEEDDDEGSFFMRHLRGIVGLALFVILLLMFVIFAFSRAGQVSLARVNAAWSKDAYSTLGYQYYQAGDYSQAGLYYERALQRDPNSYSFASSAAMAYLEAGENEKAAAMLKRCAEIDPTKLEPYVYLLRIYPDASSRPWDITQLLQQGYQRTGDARLNVTG